MDKGEGCAKNRIYVGGLGENVTADDLKNTFSSPQLGSVQSVDIIRTKGRAFAYLDFVPSSDHSILKLFSKYNGCTWKGGRLRLEKAKEHFLIRLERERAEDTKIDVKVSSASEHPPLSVMTSSLDKLKKNQAMDKMQLHIYFPKFRKIKSIPFKGSGKHKYSFQRVEVPPFPIHFCDCEEHSGSAYYTAKANETEIKMGGVDEKEMNIMSSVLNKILKRENHSETAVTKTQNVNNVADYSMREEDMVDEEDDGIIINVTGGQNHGISSSYAVSQKSDTHDLHFAESKHTLDVQKSSVKVKYGDQKIIASRKRKAPQDGEGGAVDNLSAINDKKHCSHAHGGVAVDASHVEPNMKADLHVVDIGMDITPPEKNQLHDRSGKKELHSKSNGVDEPTMKADPHVGVEITRGKKEQSDQSEKKELKSKSNQSKSNGVDEPTMKADLHTADIGVVEITPGKKQRRDQPEELQSNSNQSKSNGVDEPTMKADLHTADIGVEITPRKKQRRAQTGKKELQSKSNKSYDVDEPTMKADLHTADIGVEITPGKKQQADQSGKKKFQSKCIQSESNGVEEPTAEADIYTTDIEVKIIPPEKNQNQSHAQVGVAADASHAEPNMKTDIAVDVGVDITLPEENQQREQSGKKELRAKSNSVDLPCFTDVKTQEKPQQIGEASSSKENASGDKSSARGSSWLQTRSWAQLVGDPRNSSFSLSQFLPNLNVEKRPDSTTTLVDSQKKRQDSLSSKTGEGPILDHQTPPRSSMEFASSEEKKNNVEVAGVSMPDDHKEDNKNDEEKKHKFTMKQTPLPDIGGSFSFTRNAASMRQWRKAKSALSGSRKKKAL
ncbi:unnamed protein product [Cuscuta campestris]|uniref:RRM domain-containing protein n=1 Tax=Cuscuta campestris TaxID=132261 RepID=A0A484NIH5_9ASTE|nr:unnamed protein product [Cuscuta campestris]